MFGMDIVWHREICYNLGRNENGRFEMRTLKYAILGLLNQKSMTGYELTQQFESALCEFWTAKHSQIYPELKKLNEEGMVEYEIEITGTVLEKKLYSITEEGRADFLKWLEVDAPMKSTPKDVFRLRLFFSNNLESEVRLRLLNSQLLQHELRLQHLKGNQRKFEGVPDQATDEFSDYLVLMGAVMREEMCCEWLKKCITLCK
ncbi:negative regulator of phenolic acid metabolism PadR [Lachnospiraceae bacterium KM106-2]|nr:negative regulator of phenolic acid metabolism PadR [Lachnospiraceae bacterium KM106-2]